MAVRDMDIACVYRIQVCYVLDGISGQDPLVLTEAGWCISRCTD